MNIKELIHHPFFKKKRNIKISLSVVALYLFFLITTIPASLFVSWFNLPTNIKLSSISGSIWSGKANKFHYSNVDLGSIEWKLHPLNLLLGEISADISIVNNKQYINTELNLSPSGKIELEETRFLVDLSTLQPLTYGMPFSYAGKVSGYFPISYIHKNNYMGFNGKLSLSSMKLISPQQQTFGDFVVDFRAEEEGLTSGQIKDTGGPLDISGQVTLNKNGLVNVSVKLTAREKSSSLEQMISFLGQKDASGRVQFNHNLKLWN